MSIITTNRNIISSSDAYKYSHPFMISKDVVGLTSYIEARYGSGDVMFFGLQAYIREYLSKPITMEDIDSEALKAKSMGIPFHREMWEHVVINYNGFLPIRIQALPEGTVVPHGMPMVQVTSMDTKFPGLVSVIETSLLRAIWYASSVATESKNIKNDITEWLIKTSDKEASQLVPVMLNDFGARGVSSGESAAIGGLAHAINFIGSDTIEAIDAAIIYYDHDLNRDGPVIVSVPATEHSVTTMAGPDGERDFIARILNTFDDNQFPILSLVADSYDMDRFVDQYIGTDLKSQIENRNGFVVIRPDSGNPVMVVIRVLNMLWESFGGTTNSKGYKVLNPKVRVIQGDGIDGDKLDEILYTMHLKGFSAENIVFGMGGQLLQARMRDDHSWAMKTNAVQYRGDENWTDVSKNPKTDLNKRSKGGRQGVVFYDNEFHSIREDVLFNNNGGHGTHNFLEDVWISGRVIRTQTFNEIREISNKIY